MMMVITRDTGKMLWTLERKRRHSHSETFLQCALSSIGCTLGEGERKKRKETARKLHYPRSPHGPQDPSPHQHIQTNHSRLPYPSR